MLPPVECNTLRDMAADIPLLVAAQAVDSSDMRAQAQGGAVPVVTVTLPASSATYATTTNVEPGAGPARAPATFRPSCHPPPLCRPPPPYFGTPASRFFTICMPLMQPFWINFDVFVRLRKIQFCDDITTLWRVLAFPKTCFSRIS